jgi:hypothetical protein
LERDVKVLENIDELELEGARKAAMTVEMGHFVEQFHGALPDHYPSAGVHFGLDIRFYRVEVSSEILITYIFMICLLGSISGCRG